MVCGSSSTGYGAFLSKTARCPVEPVGHSTFLSQVSRITPAGATITPALTCPWSMPGQLLHCAPKGVRRVRSSCRCSRQGFGIGIAGTPKRALGNTGMCANWAHIPFSLRSVPLASKPLAAAKICCTLGLQLILF